MRLSMEEGLVLALSPLVYICPASDVPYMADSGESVTSENEHPGGSDGEFHGQWG